MFPVLETAGANMSAPPNKETKSKYVDASQLVETERTCWQVAGVSAHSTWTNQQQQTPR